MNSGTGETDAGRLNLYCLFQKANDTGVVCVTTKVYFGSGYDGYSLAGKQGCSKRYCTSELE